MEIFVKMARFFETPMMCMYVNFESGKWKQRILDRQQAVSALFFFDQKETFLTDPTAV